MEVDSLCWLSLKMEKVQHKKDTLNQLLVSHSSVLLEIYLPSNVTPSTPYFKASSLWQAMLFSGIFIDIEGSSPRNIVSKFMEQYIIVGDDHSKERLSNSGVKS
jgi:hypothetical protein